MMTTTTKTVFVTVGSTSFDTLSSTVLAPTFQESLRRTGFSSLVLQHGRSHDPLAALDDTRDSPGRLLQVRRFEYSQDLSREFQDAHLIISHAGAGSIIEALKAGKQLIVVANESLMDNHQIELTQKLSEDGLCLTATPNTLLDTILALPPHQPTGFQETEGTQLTRIVTEELDSL